MGRSLVAMWPSEVNRLILSSPVDPTGLYVFLKDSIAVQEAIGMMGDPKLLREWNNVLVGSVDFLTETPSWGSAVETALVKFGHEYKLNAGGDGEPFVYGSLGGDEHFLRFDARRAGLVMRCGEFASGENLRVVLEVEAFRFNDGLNRKASFFVNGQSVYSHLFEDSSRGWRKISFEIPRELVLAEKFLAIEWRMDRSPSLLELGISKDQRHFGLDVKTFRLVISEEEFSE
jgi:hypothetical protein